MQNKRALFRKTGEVISSEDLKRGFYDLLDEMREEGDYFEEIIRDLDDVFDAFCDMKESAANV